MAEARWERWRSKKNGNYYWHLVSANNQIVCSGEGYTSSDGAHRGMEAVERILGATNTHLKVYDIEDPNA